MELLIKLSVVQQKYEFFVSPSQASWKVSHGWSYYELFHIETLIFPIRSSRLKIGLRGGTSFFDGLFYRSLILVKDKREIKINAHIQDAEVTRCFTRVSFSKPCALLLLFGNTFSPTRSLCTQLRHKNPENETIEVVCRHLKVSYASQLVTLYPTAGSFCKNSNMAASSGWLELESDPGFCLFRMDDFKFVINQNARVLIIMYFFFCFALF